jgi:hypothetical protein
MKKIILPAVLIALSYFLVTQQNLQKKHQLTQQRKPILLLLYQLPIPVRPR